MNYLVKDYSFSSDEAQILIVEAVKAKVIKSVIYNGKTSYRIVEANCAGDATVLVPDTQEETSDDIVTRDTIILNEPEVSISTKDTATNTLQDIQEVNVSTIIERKLDILNNNIERRLHKIEDQIIGMQLSNLPGSKVNEEVTSENFLCVDILKNRILKLEKQLSMKTNIIDFLTAQLIAKSHDVSIGNTTHNNNHKDDISKDKNNDSPCEDNDIKNQSNKVVIIGDSMLNNIKSRGLCKSKKVDVLNFSGATNEDILTKIDDALDEKPALLIVHVGTNDLINEINLLSNAKKIVNKIKKKSPNTVVTFSNIVKKDKRNLEKARADTNSRLKNFCRQKNINLIPNDNIKEEHLGVKKLHLNRKGNSVFAKNLLNFTEGN